MMGCCKVTKVFEREEEKRRERAKDGDWWSHSFH